MAVVLDEGYTGATSGATLTTANTTFTAVGGSPTATNLWSSFGDSLSMDLSGGTSSRYGQKTIAATNLLYLRGSFLYNNYPGVTTYPVNLLSSGTIRANWRMNPSVGTVQMRNGTVAIGSASPAILVPGTAYQWLWKVDVTNQKQRLVIGTMAGALLWDSGDVASALTGSIDTIQYGSCTTAGPHYYLGTVAADDQYDPIYFRATYLLR